MTIRIGQVEEPLAPFGVARCRVWMVAGRDHARMGRVNVGMVEDNSSPPRPRPLGSVMALMLSIIVRMLRDSL